MQCSSSFEPDRGFFRFLRLSLDAIAAEAPRAYGEFVRALGARTIRVRIDGSENYLSVRAGRHILGPGSSGYDAELDCGRAAIVRLLDDRLSLLDAVLGGEVVLRGRVDDLVAVQAALIAFIHGSVRSAGAQRLSAIYLSDDSTDRRPDHSTRLAGGANHDDHAP